MLSRTKEPNVGMPSLSFCVCLILLQCYILFLIALKKSQLILGLGDFPLCRSLSSAVSNSDYSNTCRVYVPRLTDFMTRKETNLGDCKILSRTGEACAPWTEPGGLSIAWSRLSVGGRVPARV